MNKVLNIDAEAKLFQSSAGNHLFLADGSRIFDVDQRTAEELTDDIHRGEFPELLSDIIGLDSRYIDAKPISPPDVKSISLNVAQSCNLSCNYCYADEGKFGGRAKLMAKEVAYAAVDRLIEDAPPNSNLLIGYMGGEPFLNRKLVHAVTEYASDAAREKGHSMRFSVTTNGTLITEKDAELLSSNRFSVAVSIDGSKASNDSQRKFVSGRGSAYDAAIAGVDRLVERRPAHLSVRATVNPLTGYLPDMLDNLLALDVDEAGFAPVIAAPPGAPAFSEKYLQIFLSEMIECGIKAKERAFEGEIWAFSNFHTAMQQIHRGAHMPYPCSAGAGYLSVDSDGSMYGCHRLIEDPKFLFGDVKNGLNHSRRVIHLAERHVDRQKPCSTCWARYLCGGGCYHEVENRGRIGCDYIRGWLEFCLSAYAELKHGQSSYFSDLNTNKNGVHANV